MVDFDLFSKPKPEHALTLDELILAELSELDETIQPGSAYDRAIRERLEEKGLTEEQIERRLSLGRRPPKSGPGFI